MEDTNATATGPVRTTDVDPSLLDRWLKEGDATLVDVREDFEHAEERIPGAELMPLSRFDAAALRSRHPDERIVFHCRSGKRSADAAQRLAAEGALAFNLAGGIEAWKAAGHDTERAAGAPPLPIMRQVQLAAGLLVVLGVALGALVNWWFLAISAFVGCGLMFAGATGWCGMARLLSLMPWNRVSR